MCEFPSAEYSLEELHDKFIIAKFIPIVLILALVKIMPSIQLKLICVITYSFDKNNENNYNDINYNNNKNNVTDNNNNDDNDTSDNVNNANIFYD